MNKNILSDAIGGIDIDLIEWFVKKENALLNKKKTADKKSKLQVIGRVLPAAAIISVVLLFAFVILQVAQGGLPWFRHADVRFESFSGTSLLLNDDSFVSAQISETQSTAASLSYVINKVNKNIVNIDNTIDAQGSNGMYADPGDCYDVIPEIYKIYDIDQAIVMFDNNEYLSVTIKLDNPYEYYICDFYMNCTSPNAEILVDGEWQPIDGLTKIRWTGNTNRLATYTVRLPDAESGGNLTITDMRYLNKKEVSVDMSEKNVATIYKMETPVKTEFVVNTPNYYLFKVIKSDNCRSFNIKGASVYDAENNIYQITQNGKYTIDYTYSIPDTDIVGSVRIVSSYIELLTVSLKKDIGFHYSSYEPYSQVYNWAGCFGRMGTHWILTDIRFRGTGMTFHTADPYVSIESQLQKKAAELHETAYLSDCKLEISINGNEVANCEYLELANMYSIRRGTIFLSMEKEPQEPLSGPNTVVIRWKGHEIFNEQINW